MSQPRSEWQPPLLSGLQSPLSGKQLYNAGPLILTDGSDFWPCIDGIPFLRIGRDALRKAATDAIRAGDVVAALVLLLSDRKDETIPPANPEMIRDLVLRVKTIKRAMQKLNYGAMAPYIYYRWCLPSFLSGLALLESHAGDGSTLFEVGCGTGHLLRSWMNSSGPAIGSDLVFSYLWIARHFVAPTAYLVCFDANYPFPISVRTADVCISQDAFHYFRNKDHVVNEMKRVGSTVVLGHVHNAARRNFSAGCPLELQEYVDCICPQFIYDDAALTQAALTGEPATPVTDMQKLHTFDALAFVCSGEVTLPMNRLTIPKAGTKLKLNRLITDKGPTWPSRRFKEEFVDGWEYMREMKKPPKEIIVWGLAGKLGIEPELDWYARRRVMVDLPNHW